MDIIHDYKAYSSPRHGEFRITTNNYKLPEGWGTKLEKFQIIGEDDDCYIYELRQISEGVLPMGVHKTRLHRWCGGQLSLFDG